MTHRTLVASLACAGALALGAATAQADPIVWDWSPAATGASITSDNWSNRRPDQFFGERVQFAAATTITGMDVYMESSFGNVGDPVVVSIWADAGAGVPGALLDTISAVVSAVDADGAVGANHRVHADFGGFAMAAGVGYLIGMAGDGALLAQTGLSGVAGGDGQVARFGSTGFVTMAGDVQDMAFRLYGSAGVTVPEPGTFAMAGLCLALLGLAARRRAA